MARRCRGDCRTHTVGLVADAGGVRRFRIGGFWGWLIDRILVTAGRKTTPIITFDGGLYHMRYSGWPERIAPLLGRSAAFAPTRTLLLMRGNPGRFTLIERLDEDWTSARVGLQIYCHPTHDRLDVIVPKAVAADREVIKDFIETGQTAPTLPHERLELSSEGGALFQMLRSTTPPSPTAVGRLSEPSPLPTDGTMRLGLLVLTMASGDPALALSFSRRLAEIEPHHRAAMYTQVAVLSATGKQNEAERLAETWCALNPSDQKMRSCHSGSPATQGLG